MIKFQIAKSKKKKTKYAQNTLFAITIGQDFFHNYGFYSERRPIVQKTKYLVFWI